MKGINAFCPKTGASLSEEIHYDNQGHPRRAVIADEGMPNPSTEGELMMGAVRSSKTALINRIRVCHQRYSESDDALYQKAALGIQRLERAAEGQQEWDLHIWYALQKQLSRAGYDTEWMHAHVEPRCLYCRGRLKYEEFATGKVDAQCGTHCTGSYANQLPTIRTVIADLYTQAFGEEINPGEFLQF